MSENENPTSQNMLKAVLKGKFIAPHAYFGTKEKFPIINLIPYLKNLKKEEQNKPKRKKNREQKS